jgi:hypothetical protein
LRDDAQLTGAELVALINKGQLDRDQMSPSHLSRVESGAARIDSSHLARIIEIVQVGASEARELEDLRERADERGWWQEYGDVVSESVEMLVELGEEACNARSYDTAYVQGLLQTKDYAEALIGSARAYIRPIDVDRLVELRLRRQKRLVEDDFQLTAVLTEGVVRTVVGGPEVMREQLRHLNQVAREHNVAMHVLPFTAGALRGTDNFIIFEFPQAETDVVYVDGETAQRIYEDRDPVRQCTYTFDAALAQALSARESLELIASVMKEL